MKKWALGAALVLLVAMPVAGFMVRSEVGKADQFVKDLLDGLCEMTQAVADVYETESETKSKSVSKLSGVACGIMHKMAGTKTEEVEKAK